MRKFLYSKWFFGFLALVCILDLVADIGESAWGWSSLNMAAVGLDAIAVGLTLWMFIDLSLRAPKHGRNSRR
jgi:hypothetical protein